MTTAVITGATKGIGRAIAEKFAAEGINIAACARNSSDLTLLRQNLLDINPSVDVLTAKADVSSKTEVHNFVSGIVSHFGKVDILVNNAGVYLPGRITEEADGTLETLMDTNVFSAYHMTRALLPHIEKGSKPHIFNICSIASFMAYPGGGSYTISKFAMLGFSKVLREELKTSGIRVTAVMPGATWSDSWAGVDLPHERIMEAKDIADSIFSIYSLGPTAVVEEIIIRPQLGDL